MCLPIFVATSPVHAQESVDLKAIMVDEFRVLSNQAAEAIDRLVPTATFRRFACQGSRCRAADE